MTPWRSIINPVLCLFLIGCTTGGAIKAPKTICTGIMYDDAKTSLESAGFEEKILEWAITVPDNEKTYTYYLSKTVALLVFVNSTSGKVSSVVKYENIDKPGAYRKWISTERFEVERSMSTKKVEPGGS